MEIFVTRHGQTDWNALGKVQGQTDIELNEKGKKQAEKTGKLIKNEKIDLIITSPLKRAKETAQIINKNFNVPILEDKRLMERSFGQSEGMKKNERKKAKEINPKINDIWDYKRNINFNNMETMKQFCDRIYEFFDELIKEYKDKNILIVTHGGTSIIIKCYFIKYPLNNLVNMDTVKGLKNCEIIKFNI